MQEEKKKRKGYATQAQQREADKRYYHASEEIPKILRFGNCVIELFEPGSTELSQRMLALENQFYEDLQERIEKK